MRNLSVSVVLVILAFLAPGCRDREVEVAVIETDVGTVVIRFFEDDAPRHVDNFKVLARSGFYEGTYFQRIVRDQFVLGGDPETRDDDPRNDGTGGPGYVLPSEFNHRKHRRGTVAMVRGHAVASSGSQFFVCLRDLPHLDGLFTVFGEVIEGMEVMDRIGRIPSDASGAPLEKIHIRRVRIETRRDLD